MVTGRNARHNVRMQGETIIIGGGLAGLAAATALAERGISVTLLESRPRLGGRASSFLDRQTGTSIDNCQHVSMGCCTNFAHFCRTAGLAEFFRRERELYFIGPGASVSRFTAGPWPAPLHLWPALSGLGYLSREDRRRIVQGLWRLAGWRESSGDRMTFEQWLRQHGQTDATIDRFWHVVLVSALSERLDRIDVSAARKVFVDAFLAHRRGWEVEIPQVPLDELYGTRLTDWFTRHGVTVRLKSGVERIGTDGERVNGVQLRNGERLAAEHVILAVPHHRVRTLLPEGVRDDPSLAGVAELESAPISSVHLWFDRPVTLLPHAVFVDRLSQWMFNRTVLQERREFGVEESPPAATDGAHGVPPVGFDPSTSGPPALHTRAHYYQIVISASRNLSGRSQQEVIDAVARELAQVWPEAGPAELVHARMVTEHKAVFSPRPGVDQRRPPQQSPVPNLQLAGDWTDTGWPATMEGAVRSGYLAAENVLFHLNRPQKLLQPDLPVAPLSRWMLGL